MIERYTVKKIDSEIEKYVLDSSSNVEKGNLFCKWILKCMFEQLEDEIDPMYEVDGKSDNSIDAFFEEEKNFKDYTS